MKVSIVSFFIWLACELIVWLAVYPNILITNGVELASTTAFNMTIILTVILAVIFLIELLYNLPGGGDGGSSDGGFDFFGFDGGGGSDGGCDGGSCVD